MDAITHLESRPTGSRDVPPGPAVMVRTPRCHGLLAFFLITLCLPATRPARGAEVPLPATVEYDRDIRPILSDACYACHGPDARKRKAGLRLDIAEGAFAELGEGGRPFVPGQPDKSDAYKRVTAGDRTHMPPASAARQLTQR